MTADTIDYAIWMDNALRGMVRDLLRKVGHSGFPGQHHFFIAFRTDMPGVMVSDALRTRYPQEITIVLQHQFWDLHVEQDFFRVSLSFGNVPEKLVVPFAALTGFSDPSAPFTLQFHHALPEVTEQKEPLPPAPPTKPEMELPSDSSPKVIALDAFRRK